jgi:lysine 2,3-aminomutase
MIKKYHPVWLNTQFNHVNELTPEAEQAINKLLDCGVPVGNQSVLLKGVNDSPETMKTLLQQLVKLRVRPYYIYQAQTLRSTTHFITPIEKGLHIMKSIRGYTSGICEPKYVLDTPFGKVPINPTYSLGREGEHFLLRTYDDNIWREYNPLS